MACRIAVAERNECPAATQWRPCPPPLLRASSTSSSPAPARPGSPSPRRSSRRSGPGVAIALVDPRPQARDGRLRTVALAEGPRRLIEQVGAWTALAPLAQPIRRMAIYDGRARDAVRVEQLRFGGADDEPLAHMAFNDDVAAALRRRGRGARPRDDRRRRDRRSRPDATSPNSNSPTAGG